MLSITSKANSGKRSKGKPQRVAKVHFSSDAVHNTEDDRCQEQQAEQNSIPKLKIKCVHQVDQMICTLYSGEQIQWRT